MNSDLLLYVVASGAVIAVLLTLYATKAGRKKSKEDPLEVPEVRESLPAKAERSVTSKEAKKAREELRLLDLEREILSYAIRRLYEAQAEGKISEEERENLALEYKNKMLKIKETISRSESIVALHELEAMQEDLVKLFSDRFDEINKKIEDMRSSLEFEPIKEITIPSPAPPEKEKEKKRARKPPAPKKTEAEKRIEEIRAEVEKVLERLGQIEVEA